MRVRTPVFAKVLFGLSLAGVPAYGADPANPFDTAPATPARAPAPFAGTFKDNKLTLVLERDESLPGGAYRGTVTSGGAKAFPVMAEARDGKISGQFRVGDKPFPFTATLENGVMTFTTGTTTYKLASQDATAAVSPEPVAPGRVEPAAKPAVQGSGVFGLGPVPQGGVGMMIQVMDDKQIKVMGLKPDGPAARAGVREGDVLVAVDGKDPHEFKDPTEPIKGQAGTEVKLTVERGGQKSEIKIVREAMQIPGGVGANPGAVAEDKKAGVGININVTDRGAFITGVHPGGPAEAAGIRAGDQIIGIDGQPLRNVGQLSAGLPGAVGSPIKLTMRRGEQIGNFDLKRAITNAEGGTAPGAAVERAGVGILIGIDKNGASVDGVVPKKPADRAGIREGDQVLAIDGKPMRTADDLTAALPGAPGSTMRMTIRRNGETRDVEMKREAGSERN